MLLVVPARRALLTLALASGLGAAARPASASPLEDLSEGSAVFTGPTSAHPTALFINPAALGLSGQGWHVQTGSSLRIDQLRIDRYTIDPRTSAASDGPDASVVTPSAGGMLAWWSKFGDNAHFGVMLHTPFAERFPRGETALGYHSLGGYSYQTMLTAGGCYRPGNDRLLFGLTISISYSQMRYEFLRDTALDAGSDPDRGVPSDCGDGPCGVENPAAAQRYTFATNTGRDLLGARTALDVDNIGASFGLAFEIPPFNGWWSSLSYVGPAGVIEQVETEGSVAVARAPRDGGGTRRGNARITFRTPQSVWLGLRGPLLADWDLITHLRWQDMSRHNELDLRMSGGDLDPAEVPEWLPRYRGLRDTIQATVGLEQDPAADLRLGGRLRFESGATSPFKASALAFESASLALGAGVEWRLGQHTVLHGGYDLTAFLPVDTRGSKFDPRGGIECVDSGYDYSNPACEAVRDGRATPSAAGDYARLRHVGSINLRWDSL
jgi:long-subunit fatty acid transport protein